MKFLLILGYLVHLNNTKPKELALDSTYFTNYLNIFWANKFIDHQAKAVTAEIDLLDYLQTDNS